MSYEYMPPPDFPACDPCGGPGAAPAGYAPPIRRTCTLIEVRLGAGGAMEVVIPEGVRAFVVQNQNDPSSLDEPVWVSFDGPASGTTPPVGKSAGRPAWRVDPLQASPIFEARGRLWLTPNTTDGATVAIAFEVGL